MARTASAPLARASSTIRSMTWLRLSISAVVIPRSSPPTNDLNWAPSWAPMLRVRALGPRLVHHPLHDLVAALDQCGGHPPELAADQRLELGAELGADVAGPDGQAENLTEHLGDGVPRQVVHRRDQHDVSSGSFWPAYGGSALQPCSSRQIRPRSQRAGTASATASATGDRITSSVGSPTTAEQGHQFVGTRRAEPKHVQAYRDAHRPGSRGWLDLDADHAGRRPVHQPAAPPAVNSPASDGSVVPRDRAYRLAADPSPKPPPHLDAHRVPVHPYPGPGRTEPEQRQQREQQGGVADGEERVGHDVTVRPLGRTPRSRHPRARSASFP